jgi:putative membrane protein
MMNEVNQTWGIGYGWIIVLIALVVIVWMIIRINKKKKGNRNQLEFRSSLDILKERYARGEISKQEFGEKKRAIT